MATPPTPRMPDEDKPDVPAGPTNKEKGSFGRFAEKYRARWAQNHPNMRAREVPPGGKPAALADGDGDAGRAPRPGKDVE